MIAPVRHVVRPQIPVWWLRSTCRPGAGAACCRYITASIDGITCAKMRPDFKALIDSRVASGNFEARGDNCNGEGWLS
jgi:hypothetical protein